MKIYKISTIISILIFGLACQNNQINKKEKNQKDTVKTQIMPAQVNIIPNLWDSIIKNVKDFDSIFENPDKYYLKLIYTQIDRNSKQQPTFTTYKWENNSQKYVYPASIVKLLTAIFTLEKINEIENANLSSRLVFDSKTVFCAKKYYQQYDSASIKMLISKMLVYSDDYVYSILFDFVGRDYYDQRTNELGFENTQINISFIPCYKKQSVGMKLINGANEEIYVQDVRKYKPPKENNHESDFYELGNGYVSRGKTIFEPKSFVFSNKLEIFEFEHQMRRLIFPKAFEENKRYKIKEKQRKFIIKLLAAYPREYRQISEKYLANASDNYTKYLYLGLDRRNVPEHIKLINMVGQSFGYLMDCLYFNDYKNNIEFFLSFTIFVNENGILGDNKYEYNQIGFPFAGQIGKAIYDFEKRRKPKRKPDLTEFRQIFKK